MPVGLAMKLRYSSSKSDESFACMRIPQASSPSRLFVPRRISASLRISVKVISGFGERDQGRKVVLRGQEIVA